jgi:hypothetical protein
MLIVGCVIGAWAMLRIVGGEREARLGEMEVAAQKAAHESAKDAKP